jgi:4-amino-4-deoxy-L-arabinose transferase-like glycosyltransferase
MAQRVRVTVATPLALTSPPQPWTLLAMRLTRGHRAALCTIAVAVLYLIGLGRPALWEPDEGRYAEIAREMLATGDYVTPRNDWVRYFEKPPLVYWLTAGSLRLFGHNEFAVRCQAAIFSAGQVGITEALGEALFGVTAGLFAAIALALSPLFFVFARFATPDPALAFFFAAALTAFYAAASAPPFGRGCGRNYMIIAAAMLALGTLTKGPVALVLAGAIALVWLITEGRSRESFDIPWLACIAVYLAITLPWFVIAARRNPNFLHFFVIHEHLHRYLENTEHGWGSWFFIPVVIAGTWPWFYFVPIGLRATPPHGSDASAEVLPIHRGALSFLLLWFAIIFVFFSIPRSKLGEYILPGLPPLSIIAGFGLARLIESSRSGRILLSLFIINGIIVVAAVAAAIFLGARFSPALRIDLIAAVIALCAGSGLACLAARFRSPHLITTALAFGLLAMMASMMKGREDAASMYSYRGLATSVRSYLAPGCVLASYHHQVQSLPFYTGRREVLVGYRGELAPFSKDPSATATFIATDGRLSALWSSDACVILIANRNDLLHLHGLLHPSASVIGCEGKKFALFNRPARFGSPNSACQQAVVDALTIGDSKK